MPPEDANDLAKRLMASGCAVDVVEAEVGDDHVEGGVWERHVLCRLADEGAAGGDAFEVEVMLRGSSGVSAHVDVGPDIDAGGAASA